MSRIYRLALLVFLLGSFVIPSWAQFRGGVEGTVTDPSGSIVPGVHLSLTSAETQRKLETTSNDSGTYRFSSLAPGRYTVTATQKGFKETTVELNVNAEQVQSSNITLQTGDVATTVTVSAETAPAINTVDGNVTRSLTNDEITRLPQVGRDPYELLRLTPGIFGDAARSGNGQSIALPNTSGPGGSNTSLFQTENQVPLSANGQRVSANNYLLDGVSVNSLGYGGAAVVTPNQESVKEVRVNANAYSAEYGRNSGAQIETVSKNGTDKLHGSAVFLFQDPNFNAFNKPSLPTIPNTRVETADKNYAFSLGAPIIKNHLFAFFSFEGLHRNNTNFGTQYVTTPQYDQSVLALRPNSLAARVIGQPGNAARISTIIPTACPATEVNCQQVAGGLDLGSIGGTPGTYIPQASAGNGFDGIPDVANALIGTPQSDEGRQYNGRLDWSRNKDYVFGSIYMTNLDDTTSTADAGARPNTDQRKLPVNTAVTAVYTRTLTPTMLNEARANFTRFSYNQLQTSGLTNYGIPALQIQFVGVPQVQYGADQSDSSPAAFAQNTYEFRDTFSKVAGTHALKFGFELRREQDNNNLVGSARPVYAIQNLWNFANDAPAFESLVVDPRTGAPSPAQRYFRTNVYAGFVQDDWKVTPSLTLNLGIRWEYFTPPTEKQGRIYNFRFGPGFGNIAQGSLQQERELYNADRNNFAPRFGFAYNPKDAPWMVTRGGFGIFYNRVYNALFDLTRANAPDFSRLSVCCGNTDTPFADGQINYALATSNSIFSYPVNPVLASGINPVTNTPNPIGTNANANNAVEVYATPRIFPQPYVYSYSLETDFNFAHDYVFTIGMQGSNSKKLVQLVNQRFLYPASAESAGARNFSAIYEITPQVNANYNALLATVSKRMAHGLQFQHNFRWSRALDSNSYEGPSSNTNSTYPVNRHEDYGLSDFDTKFNYTASGLWELPFYRSQHGVLGKLLGGFEINSVFTFHTGFPWTPKTGQTLLTPGGQGLSPIRPYAYLGGALLGQSNDAFTRLNGNFPGGGSNYFLYTLPTGVTAPLPGIGRNVFRGPWYKSVDFSVGKITRFPNKWLGEATQLETRVNLFNTFNQQNFAPFQFGDASTFVDQSQFGNPLSELAGRVVELQARFSF